MPWKMLNHSFNTKKPNLTNEHIKNNNIYLQNLKKILSENILDFKTKLFKFKKFLKI